MTTRRELDEQLARLETRVQDLLAVLPSMLRDVHDARAMLATPTSAPAEDLPEHPEGGEPT